MPDLNFLPDGLRENWDELTDCSALFYQMEALENVRNKLLKLCYTLPQCKGDTCRNCPISEKVWELDLRIEELQRLQEI